MTLGDLRIGENLLLSFIPQPREQPAAIAFVFRQEGSVLQGIRPNVLQSRLLEAPRLLDHLAGSARSLVEDHVLYFRHLACRHGTVLQALGCQVFIEQSLQLHVRRARRAVENLLAALLGVILLLSLVTAGVGDPLEGRLGLNRPGRLGIDIGNLDSGLQRSQRGLRFALHTLLDHADLFPNDVHSRHLTNHFNGCILNSQLNQRLLPCLLPFLFGVKDVGDEFLEIIDLVSHDPLGMHQPTITRHDRSVQFGIQSPGTPDCAAVLAFLHMEILSGKDRGPFLGHGHFDQLIDRSGECENQPARTLDFILNSAQPKNQRLFILLQALHTGGKVQNNHDNQDNLQDLKAGA